MRLKKAIWKTKKKSKADASDHFCRCLLLLRAPAGTGQGCQASDIGIESRPRQIFLPFCRFFRYDLLARLHERIIIGLILYGRNIGIFSLGVNPLMSQAFGAASFG